MNLMKSEYYINRELSWLQFNSRVLNEAKNKSLPLLERLKFLAIYGTNLDEFYMIRVAGLEELYISGVNVSGPDGLSPSEQLKEIRQYIHNEQIEVEDTYLELFAKLKIQNMTLDDITNLDPAVKESVKEYFFANIFPVIIPIAIDSTHPFPHLNNLSFGLIVKLTEVGGNGEIKYGLVRIPRILKRYIEIENGLFLRIENIVNAFIDELFPGHTLISSTTFRVTRNADIAIKEEEADDFLEVMEAGLRLRQKGALIRLELRNNEDKDLYNFINSHIHVNPCNIYEYRIPVNLGSLWELVTHKDFAHLAVKNYNPKILPPLNEQESIFKTLDDGDLMLNHPYESFDPIVKFIQDSATDPDVVSIKMTLYRVGSNSPIVKSLINAAMQGKQVTAMVELKARFDEENNLVWAKKLENAGAHVVYGIKGLKVHAKLALVVKKVENQLKHYVHISTGNYNPASARVYTDVSYFTSKKEFGYDATKFFHQITGFSKQPKLNTLFMAPTQIKPKIISMINKEEHKGSEGRIIAKVNSLVDQGIIKALYKASQAGVKIDLIVRGICALRPGIEGVSENINVVSLIGKYLEHSRIFYFKHSEPSIYISSADWMPRNLERRVELMTPIFDEKISNELFELLSLQLRDTAILNKLNSDGTYSKVESDTKSINSQELLEGYAKKIYDEKIDKASPKQSLVKRLFKDS